jgi:hypothetical protein
LSPLVVKQSPLIQNLLSKIPFSFVLPALVFIRGKGGESHPTLSNHTEWVGCLGSHPQGLSPLFFSLGRLMGMGLIGFGFLVERERRIAREKISFFPCLCASRGRKSTMSFKTALFVFFFKKEK